MKDKVVHPEPVSPATQLAVMPFLAAVHGFLTAESDVPSLRITIHRTMSREGTGYLQQVSGYFPVGDSAERQRAVGRMFPVTQGIIGKAYDGGRVVRTKSYPSDEELVKDLAQSMKETDDTRSIDKVATSYVAIPFVRKPSEVVLVLYGECRQRNFFADDNRIRQMVAMCNGLCRLFDALQESPFPNLRNFPLQPGKPLREKPTVYALMQEEVAVAPPEFSSVSSFNYEASVA